MATKSDHESVPVTSEGQIVILNGAPRSGKSSIVRALQEVDDDHGGPWLNLGVDIFAGAVMPPRLRPGIGLRPGDGERPDIEHLLPALYAAFYESVAAHSRRGFNVVVDVGHHGANPIPRHLLDGLPVLVVGVRCPIEVIMQRRDAGVDGSYETSGADGSIPAAVVRWQRDVHVPGDYNLEVDTSVLTPTECAHRIVEFLRPGEAINMPSTGTDISLGEE